MNRHFIAVIDLNLFNFINIAGILINYEMLKLSRYYFLLFITVPLFTACENGDSTNLEGEDINSSDTILTADTLEKVISVELLAQEYVTYLSRLDFLSLDELNEGHSVLFSPYLFIDTTSAIQFSFLELHKSLNSENQFDWGEFDGTGEKISMSVENYFNRFVNDVNYLDDKVEMILGEVQPRGNSLSNLSERFPGATFVEFYYPPVSEELMGMDWRSLILVFQSVGDEILLKAVVHNDWTI